MYHYLVFFFVLTLSACVSSGEDREVASKVGKYLDTAAVVPLNARLVDRTHSGKIVYVAPGINGSPHFTYYEVTSKDEMERLKKAAKRALQNIPQAKKITLHFMEKQVIHKSADGWSWRGNEKEIETIVVKR